MGFDNPIKFHTFIHEIEIPSGKDEKRRQGEDSRKGGKWKSMKGYRHQYAKGKPTKASGVTKKAIANGRMVGEPFQAFETLIRISDCNAAS
jgi:hypothetical protein